MNKKLWIIPLVLIAFILFIGLASAFDWSEVTYYYNFNEGDTTGTGTIIDSTGVNNLTNYGASNGSGKLGSGYHFDGTNDYLKSAINMGIVGNKTRTITFWSLPEGIMTTQVIIGWGGDNATAKRFVIDHRIDGTNQWKMDMYGASYILTPYTPSTTNWEFNALLVNSNGSVTWYINGTKLRDGGTPSSAIATTDSPFRIGTDGYYLNYWNGSIDEVGIWNKSLTEADITYLWNGGAGRTYALSSVNVTLVSPANNTNTTVVNQTFVCNSTSSLSSISSIDFYLWNSSGNLAYQTSQPPNYTISPPTLLAYQESANETAYNGDMQLPERAYDGNWSSISSATGGGLLSEGNVFFNYTKPTNAKNNSIWQVKDASGTVNLTIPASCWNYNATGLSFRANSTFSLIPLYYITNWYCKASGSWVILRTITSSNYVYEEAMWWFSDFGTATSSLNSFDLNLSYEDNYTWNCFANDTAGISNWSKVNFTLNFIPTITYFQSDSPDPIGAGSNAIFSFNVTMPNAITTMNATFKFNNVYYNPDSITYDGTKFYFLKTIAIPTNYGNATGYPYNWSWNYTIGNNYVINKSTNVSNISVISANLTDCDTTNGHLILAMDLVDEETNAGLFNDTGRSTNIEVDLNVTSWTNSSVSWNFHKQWINDSNITVCMTDDILNLTTYRIDIVSEYGATGYVNKFWYLDNGTLSNATTFNSYTSQNVTLHDLPTADSTTFLFTYTDANGLEIDNALIHTYRKYISNGTYLEVERSKQDTNGETHVHLVEEDVIYYFMVTQNGTIIYTSGTYNAKCLSTPCSISLSAGGTVANWSIIDFDGGRYVVSSNKTDRSVTLTFGLTSYSLVNMSLYKYDNNELTLINETNLSGTSGSMNLTVPTSYGNTTFFVAIYKNNTFIKSEWVDFKPDATLIFGTFGVILAVLIVLCLMFMAITEGAGFIIFTIVGLIVVTLMTLVNIGWLALISLICAGGIIIWKLIQRKR